jgi:hypothetical protein
MGILNFLNSNNDKHKSIRIKTEIGDKFLNVNLDQTYESLDILSVKVFQKDVYRLFDSDYGIIVGRVNAKGVGIPNCRVSVFVPIDEDTVTNPLTLDDIKKIEAAAIYPYETVYDKDVQGKIYNLLPKYSKNRNVNGFPENEYGIGATPKNPVGTFPEKEEILVNETLVYVYDKYYKYTTITNESGDYILTVPANRTYTVNMSCDITDIGRFSTTPALLKLQGFSSNFFTPDGLKINVDIPLENLPNIDIQNKTITVKPLWSQNTDNTNVGINRLDFELVKKIEPFVTVIGNQFTDKTNQYWNYPDNVTCNDGNSPQYICLGNKTKGKLKTKIFTIKKNVSEFDADRLNNISPNEDQQQYNYDYNEDIELLSQFKYGEYQDGNGNFVYLIACNRNKVITDEIGNLISVDDDNDKGVFTSFRGYFYLENDVDYGNVAGTDRVGKIALKIPQSFNAEVPGDIFGSFYKTKTSWIWKHYKFDFGNIYSVAQKLNVECPILPKEDEKTGNQTNILYIVDGETEFFTISNGNDTSIKRKNINGTLNEQYRNFYNHLKRVNTNNKIVPAFKNQWMNFSIYFENFKYESSGNFGKVSPFITSYYSLVDNDRDIGAKQTNTKWLAKGTYIQTDFILIDKSDFITFYEQKYNGITQLGFRIPKTGLTGTYLRQEIPTGFSNNPQYFNQDEGNEYYFLIGTIGTSNNNILQYIVDSKII